MPDFEQFWEWCLLRYAQPRLRGMLLALQDEHDQVVMEVLLALWLLEQGRVSRPLDGAEARWLADCFVAPLRELRRAGRPAVDAGLLSEASYRQLLQLEVDAERVLAQSLYTAALPAPERSPGCPELESLAAALPGAPVSRLQGLLEALGSSGQR